MVAAFTVELTGESIWIKALLVLVPTLILAGAAVQAARIARRSAVERQREQLKHDTVRQELALAHDREMREKEREHDRDVRFRERSRDTLDSVLANLDSAVKLGNAYGAAISVANTWRPRYAKQIEEAGDAEEKRAIADRRAQRSKEITDEGMRAYEALLVMDSDRSRLQLRFGAEHEITKVHTSIRGKLREAEVILDRVHSDGREFTAEEKAKEEMLLRELGEKIGEFQEACRNWDVSQPAMAQT